ncbi:MAG: hypothetical protein WAQ98_19730, partial [Blastocatellia bacterium]
MENNQESNATNLPTNNNQSPKVVKTNTLLTEKLPSKPTFLQRFFSKWTLLALFLTSIILGTLTGLELSYQYGLTYDAQAVKQLADYKPSLVTQVIADDGKTVIGEFSLERRMPI